MAMNDTPEEALSSVEAIRQSPPPQALENSGEGHSHRGGSQRAACSHRSLRALSQLMLVLLLGIPTKRLYLEHPQEPAYLQASYLSG